MELQTVQTLIRLQSGLGLHCFSQASMSKNIGKSQHSGQLFTMLEVSFCIVKMLLKHTLQKALLWLMICHDKSHISIGKEI